jgi:hypothetical protein
MAFVSGSGLISQFPLNFYLGFVRRLRMVKSITVFCRHFFFNNDFRF